MTVLLSALEKALGKRIFFIIVLCCLFACLSLCFHCIVILFLCFSWFLNAGSFLRRLIVAIFLVRLRRFFGGVPVGASAALVLSWTTWCAAPGPRMAAAGKLPSAPALSLTTQQITPSQTTPQTMLSQTALQTTPAPAPAQTTPQTTPATTPFQTTPQTTPAPSPPQTTPQTTPAPSPPHVMPPSSISSSDSLMSCLPYAPPPFMPHALFPHVSYPPSLPSSHPASRLMTNVRHTSWLRLDASPLDAWYPYGLVPPWRFPPSITCEELFCYTDIGLEALWPVSK